MSAAMYDEDEREDSPTLGWRTSGELNRADCECCYNRVLVSWKTNGDVL